MEGNANLTEENTMRELERYDFIREYYTKHPYRIRLPSKNMAYFERVLEEANNLFDLLEKIKEGKMFQKSLRE